MRSPTVRSVMTLGAESVEPDDSLQHAAARMEAIGVGFLVVHSDRDGVVGVITDRDIVVRAVAHGADPEKARVREVMSARVVWCYDDSDVGDVVERMEKNQVRRAVVLDHQRRLVGVVSIDDLARSVHTAQLAAQLLARTSRPI